MRQRLPHVWILLLPFTLVFEVAGCVRPCPGGAIGCLSGWRFHERAPGVDVSRFNPTGDPWGGGVGYRHVVPEEDAVSTVDDLVKRLEKARPGDVVYVDDDARLDLSGRCPLLLGEGVTLASGRGREASAGALLFVTGLKDTPMVKVTGAGARATGLRMRGSDPERRTITLRELGAKGRYYDFPKTAGIDVRAHDAEIDNNQIWGFGHAAVLLYNGQCGAWVHHNWLHHNQRHGLGYGVVLGHGTAIVEANVFEWNRHAVASTGVRDSSYIARYNLALENANGHIFDVHGGHDRHEGNDIAGDVIVIHHNVVAATHVWAVAVGGTPVGRVHIADNWFQHGSWKEALTLAPVERRGLGRFTVRGNLLGPRGEPVSLPSKEHVWTPHPVTPARPQTPRKPPRCPPLPSDV